MKKLIYLPVCLGMLFFSAACENWFDVSPKSDVKAEDLFQHSSKNTQSSSKPFILLCILRLHR